MRKLFVALLLVFLMVSSAAAETAEELVAWYKGYAQLWRDTANINIDAVENYYAVPLYWARPDGPQVMVTTETRRSVVAAYIEAGKQRGITRAELQQVNATVLNPAAALIEAEWAAYGRDGNLIGDCKTTWTYLAAKTKEGWKLFSLTPGSCKPAGKP